MSAAGTRLSARLCDAALASTAVWAVARLRRGAWAGRDLDRLRRRLRRWNRIHGPRHLPTERQHLCHHASGRPSRRRCGSLRPVGRRTEMFGPRLRGTFDRRWHGGADRHCRRGNIQALRSVGLYWARASAFSGVDGGRTDSAGTGRGLARPAGAPSADLFSGVASIPAGFSTSAGVLRICPCGSRPEGTAPIPWAARPRPIPAATGVSAGDRPDHAVRLPAGQRDGFRRHREVPRRQDGSECGLHLDRVDGLPCRHLPWIRLGLGFLAGRSLEAPDGSRPQDLDAWQRVPAGTWRTV